MTADTFVARAPLAVLRVTGSDRLAYLDDVTSQHLADAEPGTVRGTLYLDPHGTVLAVMDVIVRPDDVLLLVPPELISDVLELLGGRTFLRDAGFEPTDLAVAVARGEKADEALREVLPDVPASGRTTRHGDVLVVGRPAGVDLVAEPDSLEAVVVALEKAGLPAAEPGALDDWRIRAGIPRWGQEIVAGRLPEELGLLPSHVHLAKGCYPGQEAVARMWMLGRPRRRLAVVAVTEGVVPGFEVGEGRDRAVVTSVTSDGRVGLAFVPEGTTPGTVLGDGAVEVERIVGDTLDVPGHDPAVTRRRDRARSETGST